MKFGEAQQIAALAFVLVIHVAAAALLIWAMLDNERPRRAGRPWWRPGGGPPPAPPAAPPPSSPGRTLHPLPLAHSAPSRARLREPRRIGDQRPRPSRRPQDAPERAPARRSRRG